MIDREKEIADFYYNAGQAGAEPTDADFEAHYLKLRMDAHMKSGETLAIFADNNNAPCGNILGKAIDIVYKGGQENAERQYGTPAESFERIASIASILCNKEITAVDIAKIQMSQKLVRESYAHKEDNLVDLCGYTSILNDLYAKTND